MKDGAPRNSIYGGTTGIPGEFSRRFQSLGGGTHPARKLHHLRDNQITMYLLTKMLGESGVICLFSTYVSDPLLNGGNIEGVFIENKSGRQAVTARVTVDATGEADLARRAGAPIIQPREEYHDLDTHSPTGVGMWCYVGGVDWASYDAFVESTGKGSDDDIDWSRENLVWVYPDHMLSILRKAWEAGEYTPLKNIDDIASVRSWIPKSRYDDEGLAGFKIQLDRPHGKVDAGNGNHISRLELQMRAFFFETYKFWHDHVPGFEKSYPISTSTFLGNRGGPCIEGEYTLTAEDCLSGRRFDDVVYVYGERRAQRHALEQYGDLRWTDVPYRVMVPRMIGGLLATGRSASCIPDTLLRNRVGLMHMGQVAGTAASIASERGVSPGKIEVRELQRRLLQGGFFLGDEARLRELGLG
jgi:hypothetical protein